jgi:hypothetical protein
VQLEESRVKMLFDAAIDYLIRNRENTFKKVYFLAYKDKEFETCRAILRADRRLKAVDPNPPPVGELAAESQVSQRPASGPSGVLLMNGPSPTDGGASPKSTPAAEDRGASPAVTPAPIASADAPGSNPVGHRSDRSKSRSGVHH